MSSNKRTYGHPSLEGLKCLNKELLVALQISNNCCKVVFIESIILISSERTLNSVSAISTF